MKYIKKFDNWKPDNNITDSGKGKKVWLINPENPSEEGWFKYVKTRNEKVNDEIVSISNTYENVSEKLGELIAVTIGIPNAHIDIGSYKGTQGCLSYNILSNGKNMNELFEFILKKYPKYDVQAGFDEKSKCYYCLDMILNSIDDNLKISLLKILIFDYIIGNTDRHHSNLAIMKNDKGNLEFAPLYDNGSSLCALEKEESIQILNLGKDKVKMNAVMVTKSKSMIRINGKEKSKPMHLSMMEYLEENYYGEIYEFIEFVINKLSEKMISELVEQISDYITIERKNVLQLFLSRKIEDLRNIFRKGAKK